MDVDEAGSDEQPARLELDRRLRGAQIANARDEAVANADIRRKPRATTAIDHRAVADDDVETGRRRLRRKRRVTEKRDHTEQVRDFVHAEA